MRVEKSGDDYVFAAPASYSQERLWFLDRFEPNTAIYNIPYIASVKGQVHRRAFNAAVNRLIARQESLRTSFAETEGKPRQVVHPKLTVEVDFEDLSGLPRDAAAARLQGLCTEVTTTPFDLASPPLFRIALASDGRETTIVTTLHHIISDGWSIGVFQRELAALYQEELGGPAAALPELRIQYVDFAQWQRGRLEGGNLARLRDYWLRQLAGAPTILEIPGDRPRPAKQTFRGDVHLFGLDPELTAKVQALSQRHDSTLFMTLFSAFAVLLWRLTGQRDLLVGTPIAGRMSAEVENLVGLFVNTLALRASLDAEMTFDALICQVRTMTIEAFEHQELPFERLVLELNPKRDLSHGPLVQVLFSLQNIPPLQEVMAAGAESGAGPGPALNGHTATAKFDFALFVSEVGDRLQCSIEYNTDLFSAETVAEIGIQFTTLLRGLVDDPAAPIAGHPLMSADGRARSLVWATGAERPVAEAACHSLFELQQRAAPERIAVSHVSSSGTECLTYAELNARANRMARHLIDRGAKPGAPVAICLPRGIDQIAAVLAVAKAGATYVPIDPDQPAERLRLILEDLDDPLLVAPTHMGTRLGKVARVVDIEAEAPQIERHGGDDPGVEVPPESPIYIIYTSGSTGRPKGVIMPHRAIANLLAWQAEASVAPAGATLQYAPLHFDVASQEIFSTLTAGGRLELIDDEERRDSRRLLAALAERGVERLFLPPVALEELAKAAGGQRAQIGALAEVIVAGDRLQVTEEVRQFFATTSARLVNQYGPTESHVVSAFVLEGAPAGWPALPPIGRPIDNVRLHVLDANREPVPPYVNGELYIGGTALALGYLNLPGDSEPRFVDDPFVPGERLYRTGDVCRWDRGGILSFVGRADGQIKLRGFRIEPAEIELALKAVDGIEDAVAVKRANARGDDELVAYFVSSAGTGFERGVLRARLGERLPAYMIPGRFVRLDALPLTASGKVDRLRLPDLADVPKDASEPRSLVAPRTPIEQFLVDCWCDLLQLSEISVHDNFFDLGGHSLTATQLVSRIRDAWEVEVPLFQVFERPTVEQLALEIVQRRAVRLEPSTLESLLAELESLSDDEIEEQLTTEGIEEAASEPPVKAAE